MRKTELKTESEIDKCPECRSNFIIHSGENGEIVCGVCGLVLGDHQITRGPEWRAFTLQEKADRSRVGGPISKLYVDKGLLTTINVADKDAAGHKVSQGTRRQMLRLKKWQVRTHFNSSADRNLLQALGELDRIVDKLHIPRDTHEEAANIYRKALNKDLVRGRSIAGIVAASVYAACRMSSRPRSLKEIASVSLVKKKDIARCYRLILNELSFKMPNIDPKAYVTKIATKVGIDEKKQNLAIEILGKAVESRENIGKDPLGLAAAALYIACEMLEEKIPQKEIAEAAGVTEVTVRNRYKGLKKCLHLNF
ncbi:MAG: transcription initiation factor IIB [Candidatus Bathyarchaeota archaeon]